VRGIPTVLFLFFISRMEMKKTNAPKAQYFLIINGFICKKP